MVKQREEMNEFFVLTLLLSLLLSMNAQDGPIKCYSCTNCVEPFIPNDFRVTIQTCSGDNTTKFLCKVSIKNTLLMKFRISNVVYKKKSTVRYPYFQPIITKSCVNSNDCVGKMSFLLNLGESIDCCSSDLCNTSVGTSPTCILAYYLILILWLIHIFV